MPMMTTKNYIFILLLSIFVTGTTFAQNSILRKQGSTSQLVVDGKPFLILGGELGNSSASCIPDIERIFPKLQQIGLNTVLVPVYWDLTEPTEGNFDFTLTDQALKSARQCNLKIIFLWFGAWKNSMSCYAPLWFKKDYQKYPRSYTRNGKPLEIASAFSENVFQADHRAFSQWLKHLATVDKHDGTVIMIQIENEIGMLEDARDHSKEANRAFHSPVPQELTSYLQKNKKDKGQADHAGKAGIVYIDGIERVMGKKRGLPETAAAAVMAVRVLMGLSSAVVFVDNFRFQYIVVCICVMLFGVAVQFVDLPLAASAVAVFQNFVAERAFHGVLLVR